MLKIQNVSKQYAQHKALDNISLEIPKGSIFGLLGPNGAGKTSLIRIINQITGADEGEVYFNNEILSPKHISLIGYLPEERGLYKKMEVGEQTLYLAQLKGLSRKEAEKRIRHWFKKFEIESWWNKKVEDLSKGMQQKVQFITTVIHEPELIILDEPFSGFDPINAELIKNEIIELNKKGATIIFSTHRMESVEEMCDSIALINNSKKVLDGKVKEIKNQYRDFTFKFELEEALKEDANYANYFELLSQKTNKDGNVFEITMRKKEGVKTAEILNIIGKEHNILSFNEMIPSINEIFIRTVKA